MPILAILIQVASLFTTVPGIGVTLLAIAAFVCFLLFLQPLGRFLHDDKLTRKSADLLRLGIALLVISVLLVVCLYAMPLASLLFLLPALIIGVLCLILYARLLLGFKKKLARS